MDLTFQTIAASGIKVVTTWYTLPTLRSCLASHFQRNPGRFQMSSTKSPKSERSSRWVVIPRPHDLVLAFINGPQLFQGKNITINEDGLKRLDAVVSSAEKHGIKLVLSLSNNWWVSHHMGNRASLTLSKVSIYEPYEGSQTSWIPLEQLW